MVGNEDPKSLIQLTKPLFTLTGAVVGSLQGISRLAINNITSNLHSIEQKTTQKLKTLAPHPEKAIEQLYFASGAIAGLYKGAGYALTSLWWYLTEDEIKAKLLQASPIKYQLHAEDFRVINRPTKTTITATATFESNGTVILLTDNNTSTTTTTEEDISHAVNNAYGSSVYSSNNNKGSPLNASTPPMTTPPPTIPRTSNTVSDTSSKHDSYCDFGVNMSSQQCVAGQWMSGDDDDNDSPRVLG